MTLHQPAERVEHAGFREPNHDGARPLDPLRTAVPDGVTGAGHAQPDRYVVIEPDERPGWEVKVLHMNNLRVRVGQRVTAGVTVLPSGPHPVPFESQVDESKTTDRAWPRVHVEVVDPSIPEPLSPGGC